MPSNRSLYGQFLPVSHIRTQDELYEFANNASVVINRKTNGFYLTQEVLSGNIYYSDEDRTAGNAQSDARQERRIVIRCGALPNSGTKQVAHNLNFDQNTRIKKQHAVANDTTNFEYRTLPYASPTTSQNIGFRVTQNNIIFETGADQSNFDSTDVIIEYTKE